MLATASLPTQLLAQPGTGKQLPVAERVNRTIERLKPELNLTADQVKSMTPVYTAFYTDMDKLRSNDHQPTSAERQKLMTERDDKLKTILTAEQMKKLKELEDEMRKQRPS